MATKTKPKGQAKAPASHGSWSAKNLPKKPGDIRYTDAMKKQLMAEVKKADKSGVPRNHVFAKLAKEWTKGRNKFTEHQVSSQFHVLKQRFGYDVARVSQRKIVKPSTNSSLAETLTKLQDETTKRLAKLQSEADKHRVALRSARAKAKAAERAAVRHGEKLDEVKAELLSVRAEQRKLERVGSQL